MTSKVEYNRKIVERRLNPLNALVDDVQQQCGPDCWCELCMPARMNAIRDAMNNSTMQSARMYKLNKWLLRISDAGLCVVGLITIYLAGVGTVHWCVAPVIIVALACVSHLNHKSQP